MTSLYWIRAQGSIPLKYFSNFIFHISFPYTSSLLMSVQLHVAHALDNGLSPERRQAIIWTNAGILLIGPLGTNFSEILIEIYTFSFKKRHLKMSSGKWRPFCLGLNVLTHWCLVIHACANESGHHGFRHNGVKSLPEPVMSFRRLHFRE